MILLIALPTAMDTTSHLPLRRILYGFAVVVLCISLTACDDDDDDDITTPGEGTTISDFVDESGDLSTLAEALDTAGLSDTLAAEGPYTVFAPTNAAFEALTVDTLLQNDTLLAEVLQYHVVPSAAFADDLSDGQTLTTLQGDALTVSIRGDTVQVDGATVTEADLEAENGVVHVVDGVLLGNRTAYERLRLTQATQTATQLVDSAGLSSALDAPGASYTIFAPTDDAFESAEIDTLSQEQRTAILQYHVIAGQVLATEDIEDSLRVATLQGEDVTLIRQNGGLTVNEAQVVDADLVVNNGIIHTIDGILTPPSQQDTTEQGTTTASAF